MDGINEPRMGKFSIEPRCYLDFGIGEGIAAAGVAVSLASTAAGVMAAQQQAANQQKADNYNAQVSANNSQVAKWQATQQTQEYATEAYMASQEGAQNASRLEMQNGALVAKNIAAAAASGLTLSGSTNTSIQGSAANNELAVLEVQHNTQVSMYQDQVGAANAAYNSTIQANRFNDESGLYSMESQQAGQTGLFNEVGAGIRGAASTLDSSEMLNNTAKAQPWDIYRSTRATVVQTSNSGNYASLFED
jgi:hypothetical protein